MTRTCSAVLPLSISISPIPLLPFLPCAIHSKPVFGFIDPRFLFFTQPPFLLPFYIFLFFVVIFLRARNNDPRFYDW
jgi:hypothetical protein